MQRRTILQALSAGFAALFMGVGRAVQAPLLPALRVAKRGISAMPFVKILERPLLRSDGAYVVATMVNPSLRGGYPGDKTQDTRHAYRLDPRHPDHYLQTLAKEPAPPYRA